jgi:hypothetical protein
MEFSRRGLFGLIASAFAQRARVAKSTIPIGGIVSAISGVISNFQNARRETALADLERATFFNVEHQSIEYYTSTLRPWLVRWEQTARDIKVDDLRRADPQIAISNNWSGEGFDDEI